MFRVWPLSTFAPTEQHYEGHFRSKDPITPLLITVDNLKAVLSLSM